MNLSVPTQRICWHAMQDPGRLRSLARITPAMPYS
jgi:hypothetical protein